MSIPHGLNERTKERYFVPEHVVKSKANVSVVRCNEDYGPATKLIGAIDRIPNDYWIFSIDDDINYQSDLHDQAMVSSVPTIGAPTRKRST